MVGMDRRQVLVGLGALTLAPRVAAEPRRVEIRPKVQQVIEGGRTHTLSDTIFEVPSDYAGQEIGLKIGPEAVIDVLRIRVAPGAHDIDRFMQIGPGVHIGLLDVEATRQTDHSDEKLDGFVQIRADDISIEEMRFNRIDRCVLVHRAARVRIGSFECKSYSKGMRISRSRDVTIGRFRAAASSPNAVLGKPGENGLIIYDCRRIELPEVDISDAGEHSIYVAGGAAERFNSDIHFGQVTSRRAGLSGFKCKSPVTPARDISIDRLDVYDSAYAAQNGKNEDALRVENCTGFRLRELTARRAERPVSCRAGIYLNGVRDFHLESGHVDSPRGPMVLITDYRDFDNDGIAITELNGSRLGSHGYYVHHTRGRLLSGLQVRGGVLDEVAGDAVRIEGNARIPPGTDRIRIAARDVQGALVRGAEGVDVEVTDLG